MKYRIISVGKIREKFYADGVNEYIKRLAPHINLELVEGLEEKIDPRAGAKDIERALQKEGERILSLIGDKEVLVDLDVQGKLLSSEDLAGYMEQWNLSGLYRTNVVIGSAYGLAETVKKRADHIISLSKMTFPHQMAVLILTEQIYRGVKILKGEPYHK